MPLYEYKCDACSHRFEKIVKFSDPPLEVCPKCGGKVQKLFSSPAIQFKGSGFYITDYPKKGSSETSSGKSSSDKSASEKSSSESSSSEKSSDKGTDSGKFDKSDKSDKAASTPAPAATKE